MKFTEALVLGSMTTIQAFGMCKPTGLCALETAVVANGGDLKEFGWQYAMIQWPWLKEIIKVPLIVETQLGVTKAPIFEVIYALNDILHWPRPRIAEWVKPLEDLYDVPVVKPITKAECVTR